jgi:hypothetical protein
MHQLEKTRQTCNEKKTGKANFLNILYQKYCSFAGRLWTFKKASGKVHAEIFTSVSGQMLIIDEA